MIRDWNLFQSLFLTIFEVFLDIYKSHNCHVEIIECDLTEDMAFEKEKYSTNR